MDKINWRIFICPDYRTIWGLSREDRKLFEGDWYSMYIQNIPIKIISGDPSVPGDIVFEVGETIDRDKLRVERIFSASINWGNRPKKPQFDFDFTMYEGNKKVKRFRCIKSEPIGFENGQMTLRVKQVKMRRVKKTSGKPIQQNPHDPWRPKPRDEGRKVKGHAV